MQWGTARAQTEEVLARLGVEIDPGSMMSDSECGRASSHRDCSCTGSRSEITRFDEPTSALSPEEVENLFTFIRRLRDNGVAIIYITHRLLEVPEIADDLVIFRDGDLVASGPVSEFDHDRIVRGDDRRVFEGIFPTRM